MKVHVEKIILLLTLMLLPWASIHCNSLPNPMPAPLEAASDSGATGVTWDSRVQKQADMNKSLHDLRYAPVIDDGVSGLDGIVPNPGDGSMEGGTDAGMDTLTADGNPADALVADGDLTDTLATDAMLDQDPLDDVGTDSSVR